MQYLRFSTYLFLAILLICSSSAIGAATSLSEPAICENIDQKTQAPIDPTDTFLTTTKTLQATIKLSNAPSNTTVTALFYFGEQDRTEIARDSVTTNGTGYISFALNPPESGWPTGMYQVDYYLGADRKEQLSFFITKKRAVIAKPVPSKEPAPVATQRNSRTYRAFNDKQFGFSFELPDTWNFRVIGANDDYLFQGPQESEESEIVVIVQMIDIREPPYSTINDEMANQFNMLSQRDGSEILKQSVLQIAGQDAPYILASYPAEGQPNTIVPWGHTQLGLQNGPIILLIGYAAPRDIYQRNVDVFQHLVDSIQLKTPVP